MVKFLSIPSLADLGIDLVKEVLKPFFQKLVEWVVDGYQALFNTIDSWIYIPSPVDDIYDKNSGLIGGTAYNIASATAVATYTFLLIGLIIGGIKCVITHKGESFRDIMYYLAQFFVHFVGFPLIFSLFLTLTDKWSDQLMNADFKTKHLAPIMTNFIKLEQNDVWQPVVLIMAIVGVLSCLIQMGIMVFRSAIVVIMIGLLPLVASLGFLKMGQQTIRKYVSWLIAWGFYKFTVALFLFCSLQLFFSSNTIVTALGGLMLVIFSPLILPILIKLLSPSNEILGGHSGTTVLVNAVTEAISLYSGGGISKKYTKK